MGVLLVVLLIAVLIVGPIATIWALNVLFGLYIPYTFATWLAVLILTAAFGKTSVKIK